jgi:hypothetical protein
MIRCVIALLGGMVAGSVFNMAVVMLSWAIYPPPAGADMSDPATMGSYVQSLPLPAFLLILVAHAGGAFVGGLIAALIARRYPLVLGAIVGGFFLIGGVINALSIPAPLWFVVIDQASYLPCGMIGARLAAPASRKPTA